MLASVLLPQQQTASVRAILQHQTGIGITAKRYHTHQTGLSSRSVWVSFTESGCHKDRLDHCLDSVVILSSLAVIPRYPLGIDTGITVEAKTHRHSYNVQALCVCICILLDVTTPRLLIRYNVNICFAVFLKMTIIINIGGLSILSTRHSFSLTFLTQLFESWV